MECVKCGKSATSRLAVVSCDGCSLNICKQCANLTSSEIAVIELKGKRIMKFYCQSCLKGDSVELLHRLIEGKDEIIENNRKIIELLENDIKKMREELETAVNMAPSNHITYAEALNRETNSGNGSVPNVPYIVCKPKNKQDCAKTKRDIVDKVDLCKLPVGINSVLNKRDGCVLIKCNTSGSTDRMRNELSSKMGDNYEVKETKMRNPSILVLNIEKNFPKDEIITAIRNQNSFLNDTDQMELVLAKINKKNTSQYGIIECNGSAFRKLMTEGRIYIGLRRCPVLENVKVIRCYRCYGFNHKISDCKYSGPTNCSQCADAHCYKDCKSGKISCINCIDNNSRYKTEFNVNHSVLDNNCPLYEMQIKRLKERTNYKIIELNV